jgi:GWxTD domain-containing protein
MKKLSILLFTSIIFLSVFDAEAQRRTTYENLVQRSDQPSSYIDHIVIPVTDSTANVGIFFRLDYDFVPFLRKRPNMTPPNPEDEYFSSVRMGLEIFRGSRPESRREARQTPASIYRDSWRDTVWVSTFQQTQSRYDHIQGVLNTELSKGSYHYELQLARGESSRELPSRSRNLTIPEFSEFKRGQFILAEKIEKGDETITTTLYNYGSNVLYGQDFDLLILLPQVENDSEEPYQIKFYRMRPGSETQAENEASHTYEISGENHFNAQFGSIQKNQGNVELILTHSEDGFKYTHISIPNSEFENARYRMVLTKEGLDEPIAQRVINSQWLDMPVSLYNLDVAIEMLKFILPESEVRRINSGSSAERERKFREFWAERDPTPDSEFNELMTEYYSRIDHAYRNFSSLQVPGYDTDQGKAYILYGAPDNIERRLPTNRPAREIWTYSNRTLIFEATTGFGDFRLISES